jgi:peroxiredoxin
MANLTGEYDVTAEVSIAAVNRILAALQENENHTYPVLPHSMSMPVDDTPRGPGDPVPEAERTGFQAQVEIQVSTPTISLPTGGPILDGVAWAARLGPGRVVGWDPWQASDVSIRTGVRAWVRGAPQPSLPAFLHGDLIVNANVVRSGGPIVIGPVPSAMRGLLGPLGGSLFDDTFVGLDRSSMSVTFQPAPGTTVSEEERLRVEQIVRNALRGDDLNPVTFKVAVPDDVNAWDFRLLPDRASVMVMLVLGERTPSGNAPQSVSGGLIPPGSDFAIAIGRDFILPMMKSQVIGDFPESYSDSEWGVSATIRPDWAGAGFDLEPGRIVLNVHGNGHISWWGVEDDFTFDVRVPLGLQVVNNGLEPVAAGDPEVDFHDIAVGEGYVEGKAKERLKTERDNALNASRAQIRESLAVQKRLEEILAGLHPSPAGVTLTGVEIRPEGVVVPGRIGLGPSLPVVVRQVKREGMLDALGSWIPGGTIDRFVWSRQQIVVSPGVMAAGSISHLGEAEEVHRFVTEDGGFGPGEVFEPVRCLEVQGTRVTAGGLALVSGHTCGFHVPVPPWPIVDWPVRGGRSLPSVPMRGLRPDGSMGIVGHYSPWASGLAPSDGATTMVVHFATGPWEETAKVLQEGLKRQRDSAVVVVVVLPEGGLSQRAEALDASAAFLLAEDPDGHWAEGLGVTAPATVLVDPKGQVAWKEEGELAASKLSRALSRHAEPGGKVSWQPLRLGVVAGDKPPEFRFGAAGGAELSLRRMQGRRTVLAFWTSASQPSVEQLRELKAAHESSGERGPVVLGVGDGETGEAAAKVAKEEALPFPVIPDPERAISRRYGVGCWPTTVWIGPNMRVEAVNFGLTPMNGGRDRSQVTMHR